MISHTSRPNFNTESQYTNTNNLATHECPSHPRTLEFGSHFSVCECCAFGNRVECSPVPMFFPRHSFPHQQASVTLVAISALAISVVTGYRSMCITAWGYGLGLGGYRYSLKMFALERIRAKRFTKAWGTYQPTNTNRTRTRTRTRTHSPH